MVRKIECAVLSSLLILQITIGQTAFFQNGNPISSGISHSSGGGFVPRYPPDESRIAFGQPPWGTKSFGSTSKISSSLNPPLVEKYISEFKAAVYASKILPYVLDFSDLSADAFSKALYDYIIAFGIDIKAENPLGVASAVASAIKEGLTTYDLPLVLDIYANTFAKYLFTLGTLNISNVSVLAKKFARTIEETAERKYVKYIPESKFEVLLDGFVAYIEYVSPFSYDWFEDISLQLINEVKRIKGKAKC